MPLWIYCNFSNILTYFTNITPFDTYKHARQIQILNVSMYIH